jgi:hypothetical protein
MVSGGTGSGFTLNGGVTINSSGNEKYDAKEFVKQVRGIWHDETQRAMRDGGLLSPLQRR